MTAAGLPHCKRSASEDGRYAVKWLDRDWNLSDEMHESLKPKTAQKNAQDLKTQSALAMELPVTIVGAILLAGFLGYLADRWLHTSPWLMITGGGLGFVSSMVEITRRYRPQ